MLKKQKCYLCGNEKLSEMLGSVRDNNQLTILTCDACSLVFLSSFNHINDNLYGDAKMHDNDMGDGRALGIDELVNITAEDDNRRFNQFKTILTGKKLLDFGCGIAGVIKKARDISIVADGIELERRLFTYYKENKLNVYRDLTEIRKKIYDVITVFHVLEHIADPRVLLEDMKSNLKNDGQIIIEIPNVEDALLTLYNCKPFSHFYYWSPHLFYYSAKTLEKLAFQTGFKINYIEQYQRYPLSNHLYWLAFGKPGGHELLKTFNDVDLNLVYSKKLASMGKCDTIIRKDIMQDSEFDLILDEILLGGDLAIAKNDPQRNIYFTRISMDGLNEMHAYSTDKRLYEYLEYEAFELVSDAKDYLKKLIRLEDDSLNHA